MENKVVSIEELQYKKFAQSNLNLALDTVYVVKNKRDVRREMVSGYLKLLNK